MKDPLPNSPCGKCKHRYVNEVFESCDKEWSEQVWSERLGDLTPGSKCQMVAGRSYRAEQKRRGGGE